MNKKKPNPTDATRRNTQAANKKFKKLAEETKALRNEVRILKWRVKQMQKVINEFCGTDLR